MQLFVWPRQRLVKFPDTRCKTQRWQSGVTLGRCLSPSGGRGNPYIYIYIYIHNLILFEINTKKLVYCGFIRNITYKSETVR